jgi:hypothetical protein
MLFMVQKFFRQDWTACPLPIWSMLVYGALGLSRRFLRVLTKMEKLYQDLLIGEDRFQILRNTDIPNLISVKTEYFPKIIAAQQ